jgi:hypothetical protein
MKDNNEKVQEIEATKMEMSRGELSEEQLGNVAGGIIIIGGMPAYSLNVSTVSALNKNVF